MSKTKRPIRTPASRAALERDEYLCQWCLVMLERITPASDAHHLFRPRDKYDQPEYIVSLCHEHHLGGRHIKGTITDQDLIDQIMIPYIWKGDDLTPRRARYSDHKNVRRVQEFRAPSGEIPWEYRE